MSKYRFHNFYKKKTSVLKRNQKSMHYNDIRSRKISNIFYVQKQQGLTNMHLLFICLFVCLFGGFRPTWEFFTHMESSPLPVKGCKFYLCFALMAIEQWGFFNMPHLLWHGASVYNGHLRCRAFGSGAVTTYFYDFGLSQLEFEHSTFRLRDERSNRLRHRLGR